MLDRDELKNLVRAALQTSDEELSCDECLDEVDRFVELELAGLDPAAALPMVNDHLNKCGECREEFEALLTAVRAIDERPGDGVTDAARRLWRRFLRDEDSSRP